MSFISRLLKIATLREHNLLEEELTNLKRKQNLHEVGVHNQFADNEKKISNTNKTLKENYSIHKKDHETNGNRINFIELKTLPRLDEQLADLLTRIERERRQRLEAQGKIHERLSGFTFSRKKR